MLPSVVPAAAMRIWPRSLRPRAAVSHLAGASIRVRRPLSNRKLRSFGGSVEVAADDPAAVVDLAGLGEESARRVDGRELAVLPLPRADRSRVVAVAAHEPAAVVDPQRQRAHRSGDVDPGHVPFLHQEAANTGRSVRVDDVRARDLAARAQGKREGRRSGPASPRSKPSSGTLAPPLRRGTPTRPLRVRVLVGDVIASPPGRRGRGEAGGAKAAAARGSLQCSPRHRDSRTARRSGRGGRCHARWFRGNPARQSG